MCGVRVAARWMRSRFVSLGVCVCVREDASGYIFCGSVVFCPVYVEDISEREEGSE